MTSQARRAGPLLAEYLIAHGFTPEPGHPTWHDHHAPDGIIRVVCEPGEETQLISLSTAIGCRYKAMFYVGTPDAVIIAAVEAALSLPLDYGPLPGPGHDAAKRARRGRPQEGRPR